MSVSVLNTDAGLSGKTVDLLESDQTITGNKTFDRDPNPPFSVSSGSAVVPNLDADKLDGKEAAEFLLLTGGTVSGATSFSEIITGAKGVAFPAVQVASSNVNTLDDYKEGTWTPVLGGDGGTSGQTYTRQVGRYTKVGNRVHCTGDITLSAKGTITGAVIINGLPFTVKDTTDDTDVGTVHVGYFTAMTTNWIYLAGHAGGNTTKAVIYGSQAAATAMVALATADISNTTRWIFSITYEASA